MSALWLCIAIREVRKGNGEKHVMRVTHEADRVDLPYVPFAVWCGSLVNPWSQMIWSFIWREMSFTEGDDFIFISVLFLSLHLPPNPLPPPLNCFLLVKSVALQNRIEWLEKAKYLQHLTWRVLSVCHLLYSTLNFFALREIWKCRKHFITLLSWVYSVPLGWLTFQTIYQ